MSKHLKQVHGEEIAREQRRAAELAAGSFAQLVSKQAEKPEKIQPEKQHTSGTGWLAAADGEQTHV